MSNPGFVSKKGHRRPREDKAPCLRLRELLQNRIPEDIINGEGYEKLGRMKRLRLFYSIEFY